MKNNEPGHQSFEWDPRKAVLNFKKHGVSFEEAAFVFSDPLGITIADKEHSDDEDRWISIGCVGDRVLVIIFTYPNEPCDIPIRLISARMATAFEMKYYEEGV